MTHHADNDTIQALSFGRFTVLIKSLPPYTRTTRRQSEQFVVAQLIHSYFGDSAELHHHQSGAPYIVIGSHTYIDNGRISISHGAGVAALAISNDAAIGIDVECWRDQLQHVASRFLRPEEMSIASNRQQLLTAWTIKEAVYKAAGLTNIELRDIHLPLPASPSTATIVKESGETMQFAIYSHGDGNMMITLAERKD